MSGYVRIAPVLGLYGKVVRFASGETVHDTRPGQVVVRVGSFGTQSTRRAKSPRFEEGC